MQPESTWTKPSSWCPHPGQWTSTDAESTEIEVSVLVAAFVTALQPDLVVETGTAWGQTAETIGFALQENGHGRLITFETQAKRVEASRERCKGLPVEVVHGSSLSWKPDDTIDFAWFDSAGGIRLDEFNRYLPNIRPGAIVGFHDTAPHHGIGRNIVAHPSLTAINLHTPRGVVFGQVP